MKITTLIATVAVLSSIALQAQQEDTSAQQDKQNQELNQSGQTQSGVEAQTNDIIDEPSGAEAPEGRPYTTNQPPGRAFSTNNPPEGRPFQEGQQPPGRPFQQGEEDSDVNEPSGAETPDASQTPGQSEQEAQEPSGAESQQPESDSGVQDPSGAEQTAPEAQDQQSQDAQSTSDDASSTSTTDATTNETSTSASTSDASQVDEAAGAQRGSEQLANALGNIKVGATATASSDVKMQIKQAISASGTTTTKVPDEFVDRLATDLSTSFSRVQLSPDIRSQVATHILTVLNAQPGNTAQIEQALNGIQTVLIDNGVSRTAARAVGCDLHLIATEVAPGLQLSVPVPK